MRSLTVKLVLAFSLVSLVGILLVAVMAARFSGDRFREVLEGQNRQELISDLGNFYRQTGTWRGIERLANNPRFVQKYPWGFIILDPASNVVLRHPSGPQFSRLFDSDLQVGEGIPIMVDDTQVGTYHVLGLRFDPRLPLSAQIASLYRSLILASLGAVLASVILGSLLARTLTRPLRELTAATKQVARGDLDQQVPVRSKDELGELAASFNRMSADLTQSRNLRRQMTADIAHELRTPLTVILGHTEALSEGELPPDPETFEILHDETKRLNRLVEDLRTLSLSDAGELQLNLSNVQPEKLLRRAATTRKPEAKTKGIDLQIELEPDLPSVEVDEDRMTQVVVNLLDNALRYTPEGGLIKLTAHQVQDGVEISIQDSGPGIPAEDLEHLFERFYRGDKSRQREEGGSGLGLAIAKSLVESQGGEIRVENRSGGGAKFVVKILVPSED